MSQSPLRSWPFQPGGLRRLSLIVPVLAVAALAGALVSHRALAETGGPPLSASQAPNGSAGGVVVQSVGTPSLPVGTGAAAPSPAAAPAQPLPATLPGKPVPGALLKPLSLEVGSGQVVTLPAPAANVFEADPKIAEVRPASANTLFVFGVGSGRTTVAAMDSSGAILAQFSVSVTRSEFSAREAQTAINRVMPGSHIGVTSDQRGLLLTGRVESAAEAARAVSVARGYIGDGQVVENQIVTSGKVQVALRVRIAEMSREVTRALGVNWSTAGTIGKWGVSGSNTQSLSPFSIDSMATAAASYTSGNFDINATVDALAQDNLVHLLAEPNLTTMSGEPASFLVGGEFPIPVSQSANSGSGSTITVEFKRYGVSLSFVPTVMSDGRINLHVSPEVSELTTTGAVSVSSGSSSISIPALLVRRAETTVELGSGQSFVIAGLLQDSGTTNVNAVPGLGEVPILGALFRSNAFQRKETELVIMVTPYIVRPVDNLAAFRSPTDGMEPANDAQRFLQLKQFKNPMPAGPSAFSDRGGPQPRPASAGQAGFLVQ